MKSLFFIFLLIPSLLMAQQQPNTLLQLLENRQDYFGHILQNPQKYEVQILYTQIDRDKKNRPTFTTYRYGDNPYFYPASTVKFPACLLALEKINQLKIKGLNRNTTMLTDVGYEGQTSVSTDTTAASGLPSVGHYVKKILMVSDNDAFNRLYEFVGQETFNEQLHKKGYKDTRIVHRLEAALTPEQNRHTNPIRFVEGNRLVYSQAAQVSSKIYAPENRITKGKGYYKGDKLIEQPFDFTNKNYFALDDQHQMLKAVLFPASVPAHQRFDLSQDDYRFLYQYMSQLPTESVYPTYSAPDYYPTFCKFLLFGSHPTDQIPKGIRIFNKVGDAYGFLLDNAYIIDFEKGVEFMVSAVIYANEDGIFNDDKYDYDTVGYPFFQHLGEVIYQYECTRPRPYKPDLSKFVMKYDK
jgi:Beta-lactamase enzyme family